MLLLHNFLASFLPTITFSRVLINVLSVSFTRQFDIIFQFDFDVSCPGLLCLAIAFLYESMNLISKINVITISGLRDSLTSMNKLTKFIIDLINFCSSNSVHRLASMLLSIGEAKYSQADKKKKINK